jgi:hypothetical protein
VTRRRPAPPAELIRWGRGPVVDQVLGLDQTRRVVVVQAPPPPPPRRGLWVPAWWLVTLAVGMSAVVVLLAATWLQLRGRP